MTTMMSMAQHDLEVLKQELELARIRGAEGFRLSNIWMPTDNLQWLVEEALKNANGAARRERDQHDGETFNCGVVEGYNDAIAIVRNAPGEEADSLSISREHVLKELEEAKKEVGEG